MPRGVWQARHLIRLRTKTAGLAAGRHSKMYKEEIKGFTLVEVLVSSVIFSFAVVGILAGYVNFAALNEYNRNLTFANAFARLEIEDFISDPACGSLQEQYFYLGSVPFFMRTTTVCAVGTNVACIRVAVGWREKNGRLIGEVVQNLAGILEWIDNNPVNGKMDAPVVLETSAKVD